MSTILTINFIILMVTGCLNLFLGFIAYLRAADRKVGRDFFLLMVGVTIWIFGLAFLILARTEAIALWVTRLHLLGPIFIPYFFHRFVAAIRQDVDHELPTGWKWFYRLFIPTFLICLPTPWMIRHASVWGTPTTIGPVYWLFGAYILMGMGHSIRSLVDYSRKAKSFEKVRVLYLLVAVTVGSAVGIGANLLLRILVNLKFPLQNNDRFTAIGPLGSLIMAVIIAYAIIKHQLLDIKVIVRLTVVYGLLGAKAWPGIRWEGFKQHNKKEPERPRLP
jgi:hypothetical protein